MKSLTALIAVLALGACATQHRPRAQDLQNVYIDCTNRVQFEHWYNQQLRLTDMGKIEQDPVERQYYAAIKDRLWTLRSVCQ